MENIGACLTGSQNETMFQWTNISIFSSIAVGDFLFRVHLLYAIECDAWKTVWKVNKSI